MLRLAFLVVLLLPRPGRACSVCGCDPSAGTLGLERPGASSLRIALEDRYLAKESGAAEDRESEREDRLVLRAQYAPAPRLVFQVELPWFLWKRHLDAGGAQDDDARGLGDAALAARVEVLRLGLEARQVLAVTGTLKLPTGDNARRPLGAPDEHLQLGTGSLDGLLGVSYLQGLRPWTLFADLTARLNGGNARGFRYGHALFATLGARRALGEEGRFVVSAEAQLRAAGKDRLAAGGVDADSGGQLLYGTLSAAASLTDNLLLRAIVQVPTLTALNGAQSEHPVGYLALSYDFAL